MHEQNSAYTPDFVYEVFQEIDQGLYTNEHFSKSNVVLVSKDHYDALCDAWEKLHENENA